MRRVAYLAAMACAYFALPIANRYGVYVGAGALLAIGIGLALLASATSNALSVSTGAFAALGAGVLGANSPAAAGAVFLMLVFAERSLRVRGNVARAAHVLLCLVGGGMAGALASAYTNANTVVYGVACATAAVLSGLPLLISADDPIAHSLDLVASSVREPSRGILREGAEIRRQSIDVPLDPQIEKSMHHTWLTLMKLAEARAKIEPHRGAAEKKHVSGVVTMLDKRIKDHVALLTRALTAMDTATAARIGQDDSELKNVQHASDMLEATGEAAIEMEEDAVKVHA